MRYADKFCTYTEEYFPVHIYIFTGPCVLTGKNYSVIVDAKELYNYRTNDCSIQDAFPNMPECDREFLMSGISPKGWDLNLSDEE